MAQKIDGAPTFKEQLFIRQDPEGERLMFECRVVSDIAPEVTWLHNDLKVKADERRKIEAKIDGDNYLLTLEIIAPTRKDAGKYQIKVKNEKGDAKNQVFSYIG